MRPLSSTPPEPRSTRPGRTPTGRAGAPGHRPRLLASVTDASEALLALAAGVDVIDLKDPRRGALGACPPHVLREVVSLCETHDHPGTRPAISAAIGDLVDGMEGTDRAEGADRDAGGADLIALAAAGAAACGVDFVKVGVRIGDPERAVTALRAVARAVRDVTAVTRIIAATYVDLAREGAACDPETLVTIAARAELDGCLLDTARKEGRTILDHAGPDRLASFVAGCRETGLICALAGSIRAEDLPVVVPLGPDYIGARGALCAEGRTGRLDVGRVRAFSAAIRSAR